MVLCPSCGGCGGTLAQRGDSWHGGGKRLGDVPSLCGRGLKQRRAEGTLVLSAPSESDQRDVSPPRFVRASETSDLGHVHASTSDSADHRRSLLAYVLVGDPKKGMLGLGRGRGTVGPKAIEAAFYDGTSRADRQSYLCNHSSPAVLNMDTVDRYEGRTLWGQGKELETKFASTKVSLRARPPGE